MYRVLYYLSTKNEEQIINVKIFTPAGVLLSAVQGRRTGVTVYVDFPPAPGVVIDYTALSSGVLGRAPHVVVFKTCKHVPCF